MKRVVIAEAKAGDGPALARVLSDWIDATPWMPRIHSRDEDAAFVADLIHSGNVKVVYENAAPVGFLFEEGGHIGSLYVSEAARGRGYGKRLIDAAKEGSDRLDLWTFEANEDARRFYARQGFEEVERTAGGNDEGLPDIRMVWRRERSDG